MHARILHSHFKANTNTVPGIRPRLIDARTQEQAVLYHSIEEWNTDYEKLHFIPRVSYVLKNFKFYY